MDDIAVINNITNPNLIVVGNTLTIGCQSETSTPLPPITTSETVPRTDTVFTPTPTSDPSLFQNNERSMSDNLSELALLAPMCIVLIAVASVAIPSAIIYTRTWQRGVKSL